MKCVHSLDKQLEKNHRSWKNGKVNGNYAFYRYRFTSIALASEKVNSPCVMFCNL